MPRERIISGQSQGEEENHFNYSLRPQNFDQYIGQPALGKTTLAHVVANEMRAKVHTTNGPALTKGADLVGILTKLEKGDVLFIDEVHRLPAIVEEYLYP